MGLQAEILQKADLKSTSARLVTLHYLQKDLRPVSIEEILDHLKKHKLNTDRATVYRTLNTFYEKGIVDKLEFQEGKFRYELKGEDHHHVICKNCGYIEDIAGCNIGVLENEITSRFGFKVDKHNLEFFGLCKTCQ